MTAEIIKFPERKWSANSKGIPFAGVYEEGKVYGFLPGLVGREAARELIVPKQLSDTTRLPHIGFDEIGNDPNFQKVYFSELRKIWRKNHFPGNFPKPDSPEVREGILLGLKLSRPKNQDSGLEYPTKKAIDRISGYQAGFLLAILKHTKQVLSSSFQVPRTDQEYYAWQQGSFFSPNIVGFRSERLTQVHLFGIQTGLMLMDIDALEASTLAAKLTDREVLKAFQLARLHLDQGKKTDVVERLEEIDSKVLTMSSNYLIVTSSKHELDMLNQEREGINIAFRVEMIRGTGPMQAVNELFRRDK